MSREVSTAVYQRVQALFDADAQLVAYLGGTHTYGIRKPQGLEVDRHITLGSVLEHPAPIQQGAAFMRKRIEAPLEIHLWSKLQRAAGLVLDPTEVTTMYGHVRRLLHEQSFVLFDELKLVRAAVELLGVVEDPDGVHLHGPVRLTVLASTDT